MPGKRLNDTEKNLKGWWDNGASPYPKLRSITVGKDVPLRGLSGITVDFPYPVVALCGRNGSGKSTLLALSTLAFQSPGAFPAYAAPRDHYTFGDFFYRGPGDPSLEGVRITWNFEGATTPSRTITKQSDKWMHYKTRPTRPVYYVGAMRCVPAVEQRVLRSHFNTQTQPTKALSDDYRAMLSTLMGRQYGAAEIAENPRYSVRSCSCQGTYSSFNMGAGEDVLVELLYLMQEAPDGSLVVIEEVELGLHPSAASKLAKVLQEVALKKKLQIVVSTHSEHFIDALPRWSRVLIQSSGGTRTPLQGVTTRFVMGDLVGAPQPELDVYCEDSVAAAILRRAITHDESSRLTVHAIGSDSQLVPQARFHLDAGFPGKVLLVWDGDVTDQQQSGWLGQLSAAEVPRVSVLRLPGPCAPETWLLESSLELDGPEGVAEHLSEELVTITGLLNEMKALPDPHDIPYELARRLSVSEPEALAALTAGARQAKPDEFTLLREAVLGVLNG